MSLNRFYQHLLEMLLSAVLPRQVFIGGGAARDLALARGTPKDVDLVLLDYNMEQLGQVCRILVRMGYSQVHIDGESTGTSGDGSGDNAFASRWRDCLKFEHSIYPDLDLLLATSEHICAEDIVAGFDFNINQYVVYPGDQWPRFLGKNEGVFLPLREDGVSPERANKMRFIAMEGNWHIPHQPAAIPHQMEQHP